MFVGWGKRESKKRRNFKRIENNSPFLKDIKYTASVSAGPSQPAKLRNDARNQQADCMITRSWFVHFAKRPH
ncbi:hypothetical protein AGR13a_Cc210195 [Agrobacterium genomosp. 13 str. CFBP 6927]|uniref:Uncharacterized protein n=1 Tax=Agrobacterium genomosp. 13 str. CFBP 6927 TaxID=1183428 RepID=A0ABM9VDI9_9HYPH|nr:hypothetical protein AGR13a_Cc210195 [Agrobacterium genomosp. 13 str. CFBP 6927]